MRSNIGLPCTLSFQSVYNKPDFFQTHPFFLQSFRYSTDDCASDKCGRPDRISDDTDLEQPLARTSVASRSRQSVQLQDAGLKKVSLAQVGSWYIGPMPAPPSRKPKLVMRLAHMAHLGRTYNWRRWTLASKGKAGRQKWKSPARHKRKDHFEIFQQSTFNLPTCKTFCLLGRSNGTPHFPIHLMWSLAFFVF